MERNEKILEEVLDEIEAALKDPKGIIFHQRRLILTISLGVVALIENYLDKLKIFKSGAKIDHRKFKKKKERVLEHISNQITSSVEEIPKIEEFIGIAYELEKDRNLLAYGKETTAEILKEKINLFFKLKKELEIKVGEGSAND